MGLQEKFIQTYHEKAGNRVVTSHPAFVPQVQIKDTISIAVINQKGGCGKTTTTSNLSACLVEMGYNVLVVDLDPQAHLTLGLGIQGESLKRMIYHALRDPKLPLTQVVQATYHRNLKLLPSNGLLAEAQVELMNLPEREGLLKKRLSEIKDFFQFILIDCPPTLNLLTINALTAASRLIIPIQTQYYSLDGMRELFKTIDLVKQNYNPDLSILGILPTLYDARTKLNKAMLEAVREYFSDQIFDAVIHSNAALAECPMRGRPVTSCAPGSRGANDYRALAQEVIIRVSQAH